MSPCFNRLINSPKVISVVGFFILANVALFGSKQEVSAQSCNYFAGNAVGGQKVNLNTCSINRVSHASVDFIYFLGKKDSGAKLIAIAELGQRFLTGKCIVRNLRQPKICLTWCAATDKFIKNAKCF